MPSPARLHLDAPWKRALTRYFPLILYFCFRDDWSRIDWSRGFLILEQELGRVSFGAPRQMIADTLARVYLRGGVEQTAIVHVEIQLRIDPAMAERMYRYYARIYEQFGGKVISLVLHIGRRNERARRIFDNTIGGVGMNFQFRLANIEDFEQPFAEMLADKNPFAVINAAAIFAIRTRQDMAERYKVKLRLTRSLFERGWGRQKILDVFRVINELLELPDGYEHRFWRNVRKIEREYEMENITTLERIFLERGEKLGLKAGLKRGLEQGIQQGIEQGIERGIEQGIEQGIERGIEQGRRAAMAELLLRMLEIRFGPVSETVRKRVARARPESLAAWSEAAIAAETLKQVFGR